MIRVGVLRGGPGSEYHSSLISGAEVLRALSSMPEKYIPVDIFIDRDGLWHMRGQSVSREAITLHVDVFWNALHGVGEDGLLAQLLDDMGIPYVGAGALASALSKNKLLTKQEFLNLGYQTPQAYLLSDPPENGDELRDYAFATATQIFSMLPPPWILKPKAGTNSRGVFYALTFGDLVDILAANADSGMMVEEYISGKEIVLGMIEGFRGKSIYHLLPSEIQKPNKIWDTDTRQGGGHRFLPLAPHISIQKLEEIGERVFNHFGLRHFATLELIENNKGLYLLDLDTVPHMHTEAYFPHALSRVGATLAQVVDHLVEVALKK